MDHGNLGVASGNSVPDATGSVGRFIVHDQDLERRTRLMNGGNEPLDVRRFIVSRNDDNRPHATTPGEPDIFLQDETRVSAKAPAS
jgi:hypothetical protein